MSRHRELQLKLLTRKPVEESAMTDTLEEKWDDGAKRLTFTVLQKGTRREICIFILTPV